MAEEGYYFASDYIYDYDDYDNISYDYNYSYHTLLDHNDYSRGLKIYKWMLVTCIIPVCIAGLGANTVSVWVWHINRKPNPIVLLFQCLGILDNVFLLGFTIRAGLFYKSQLTSVMEKFLLPLLYLFQTLSVHVTLIISVFRWLAVSRPQRKQEMTRGHVIVTCVVVTSWCIFLAILLVVMMNVFHGKTAYGVMFVLLQMLGFVLPILVLLGFSVRLLRLICQYQKRQVEVRHKKLTMAVLGIAVCSFLACPLGVWAHILPVLLTAKVESGYNWTCIFAAFGTGDLLQVLNSSVNFIFYFVFASNFRPLVWQYFCCWQRAVKTERESSIISDVELVPMDSGSGTTSVRPNQPDAKVELVDAKER